MHCRGCDYSLEHLKDNRCPECGRAFDPDDPQTYRPLAEDQRRYETAQEIKGTLIAVVFTAAIGIAWLIVEVYLIGHGVSGCGCCYLWLALFGLLIGIVRIIRIRRGNRPDSI